MNLFPSFEHALPMSEFLAHYGSEGDRVRWQTVYERVHLTQVQRTLLGRFQRVTNVLVLAGAWCGDCANQCPIFERFAEAAPVLNVRFIDRDEHAGVQQLLQINGGNRVPVVVFFSEDGYEVARHGERQLGQYRTMMAQQLGESFPDDVDVSSESLLTRVMQDWLEEFERVQWLLRLSPRLRQRHRD